MDFGATKFGMEKMQARILKTALLAFVLSGTTANAQSPALLKQFNQWATYTYNGQGNKICYAVSTPQEALPADRNHGDVFFFVSNRPNQGVANEPNFIVGYQFKEGSLVTIDVDGQKFSLFTKGDGAWVQNAAEEKRLVEAMKAGRAMTISGYSSRGTATNYKYSLSGVTASIRAADNACR